MTGPVPAGPVLPGPVLPGPVLPGQASDGSLQAGLMLIGAAEMAGADRLERVMAALAEVFADLSAGRTRSPSRTVIEHGADRQLVVGPAIWERRGVGSVKITTLTPGNPGRGLPLIHGVVVLTDLDTGQITALLDGGELTAVRTSAVAALATRLCAAPDAEQLAVIGAGVQARALVLAMLAVRPIRSIRVFSRTEARAESFAEWAQVAATSSGGAIGTSGPGAAATPARPPGPASPGNSGAAVSPVRVTVCDTVMSAVNGAEIICTATSISGREPLVAADWVAPGAHVNVIGGTHEDAIEVDPALLAAAFVVVEQRAAALEEAGEIRAALAAGLITADHLQELGTLVGGAAPHSWETFAHYPGKSLPEGACLAADRRVSVFRSVGMAIEDTAAAAALRDAMTAPGRGVSR